MKTEEIRTLPKIVRLAGYIARMAALDERGARSRTAHQHESTDYDEKWTEEEDAEWERLCDEIEPWEYALSEQERKLLEPVINFMACLCRGENPEEHIELTMKLKGKYLKKDELLSASQPFPEVS